MYKNYSKNTIDQYVCYLEEFLNSFSEDGNHISAKQAENFLRNKNYTSISQQNGYISAVKIFFKEIRKSKLTNVNLERPRKEKHLPKIIDRGYLLNSISNIKNLKHKAIISIAYSVGLRVSEVCNLKISDIDSKRMVINIKNAKGNKDRIAPLSENILKLLREYYKEFKPKEYLFEGQFGGKYSHTSCNNIVKKYLGDDYHFHLLRHSCFTNLTDQGVDIHAIQKLAGHNSSKETEIYLQMSSSTLQKLP